MRKVYFICPFCEEVTDNVSEFSACKKQILESELTDDLEEIPMNILEGEEYCLKHNSCDKIMEGLSIKDIFVVVEDGKITKVGEYWKFGDTDSILIKIAAKEV